MKSILIALLMIGSIAQAKGSESHGGSTVVCFTEPSTYFMVDANGVLTSEGEKKISSIVTLEYYLASFTGNQNPDFKSLENLDYPTALQKLHKILLASLPKVYDRIVYNSKKLGQVKTDGVAAPFGLERLNDAGTVPRFPSNCALVQTVYRRSDVFYYYPAVYNRMSDYQKALMQLHEELYFYFGEINDQDSEKTQLLLSYMLSTKYTVDEILEKAKYYGFRSNSLETILQNNQRVLDLISEAKTKFPLATRSNVCVTPPYKGHSAEVLEARRLVLEMNNSFEELFPYYNDIVPWPISNDFLSDMIYQHPHYEVNDVVTSQSDCQVIEKVYSRLPKAEQELLIYLKSHTP